MANLMYWELPYRKIKDKIYNKHSVLFILDDKKTETLAYADEDDQYNFRMSHTDVVEHKDSAGFIYLVGKKKK